MRTAGRPASPTLHPRTRPEANDIATKHRATGDWFRHDGKNVEQPEVPPQRLHGYVAPEVAEKAKGDSENWFEHDPNNPPEPAHAHRVHTKEAQKIQEKIEGKEEAWYKTEENQDYHTPRPKSRVTTVQGQEVMDKLAHRDTNQWFQHEHGKGDDYQAPAPKSRTGPTPQVGQNKAHIEGKGAPEWYQHKGKAGEAVPDDVRPHSRVHTADAQEYLDRNRGSAGDWYQHNKGGAPSDGPVTPRPARPTTKDSENWFNHDANQKYTEPKPAPKAPVPVAKEMVEKGRGKSMEKALTGAPVPTEPTPPRVKPEASGNAQKNQGMMSKYLNQDANKGYQSSRGGGRVVKQEATANASRNRGSLGDNLGGGYAAAPPAKRDGPRVRPEAATNAQKNKGSMGAIMGGGGGASSGSPSHSNASPRPASRVKPEAAANRDRNAGQGFSALIGSCDNMSLNDQPKQRVVSASARAAADRNKGSIGSLLGMG